METFIQPKITGYRQLTPNDAALMNQIKEMGVELGLLVAKLRKQPATPANGVVVVTPEGVASIDQRWVSIGATHLQEGLMALTRGVAQPTTF